MLLKYLYNYFTRHKGDTKLFAVKDDGQIYETGMKVDKYKYPDIVKIYATMK